MTNIAIGIGCRKGCSADAIEALVHRALDSPLHANKEGVLLGLFTVIDKKGEAGLIEAADRLGLGLFYLSREALREREDDIQTPSPLAESLFGVPSVAEAAALAGAGPGSVLIVPRLAEGGATCAIAGGAVMTVHFIGAGPGAPDLITVRGRDLIARCPVCLYAGSLVPAALLAYCPPGARIVDTAPLSLDGIAAEFVRAHDDGQDIARLHSGDLSVWSAMGEQLRRLDRLGIPYSVTPGVPSFAAAAAALNQELTLPGVTQSLVLTRTSGRASAMPEAEKLASFAATGATLAIHLSIHVLDTVVAELTPHYGADCPVAIVYRASWPDQQVIRGDLATIAGKVAATPIERTALILVGPVLASRDFAESALYDPDYLRRFRPDRSLGDR